VQPGENPIRREYLLGGEVRVGVDGIDGDAIVGDSVIVGEGSGLSADGGRRGGPEGILDGGEKKDEIVGSAPAGEAVGAAGVDVRSHTSKLTWVK
jgi:hypothetical protein